MNFSRFSKAIGAGGGGLIGAIISLLFVATGHAADATTPATLGVFSLPVIGGILATILAPANTPYVSPSHPLPTTPVALAAPEVLVP